MLLLCEKWRHGTVSRGAYNVQRVTKTRPQHLPAGPTGDQTVKAKPTLPPAALSGAEAFGSAIAESMKAVSGLNVPMDELSRIQGDYLKAATDMWNQSLHVFQGDAKAAPLPDRRFAGSEWLANPMSAMTAQMYLLNARTLMDMAEHVQGDAKTKARIRFAVQQFVDASSPSNFLALNPDALKKALETKGESIATGMQHLLEDIQKGHVSQTDESVFEVGKNVATTAGTVVFDACGVWQ